MWVCGWIAGRLVRVHMRGGVAVAVAVAGGDKMLNLISITCT